MSLAGIKSMISGNVPLLCGAYMALDIMQGFKQALGLTGSANGSAHSQMSLERSVSYVETVFNDYKRYGLSPKFHGTVAEIGPGDNFGVALMMLADGADQVIAIDRFQSYRDDDYQSTIYAALNEKHDLARCFDGPPSEAAIKGLRYVAGVTAEHYFNTAPQKFGAVVSRAVLEHLMDPIGVLGDASKLLEPGGFQTHEIDLRDHGMFRGHHPLTFLTIPDRRYKLMTRNAGRPNRVLMPAYIQWAQSCGLEYQLLVKGLVGIEDPIEPQPWDQINADSRERSLAVVRTIRPQLDTSFQSFSDEELAPSILILSIRKPVEANARG